MPHPWVYSATITGDTITFSVEVTDLQDVAGAIEITGEATQVNGALAQLSRTVTIADAYNGAGDDQGLKFVDVPANPVPGHPFDKAEDVTVFVQVSEAWSTVLGPGTGKVGGREGDLGSEATWGNHKEDTHIGTYISLTPPPSAQ